MQNAERGTSWRSPLTSGGAGTVTRIESAPARTRTLDPLIKSQLLYQLSYRGVNELTNIPSNSKRLNGPKNRGVLLFLVIDSEKSIQVRPASLRRPAFWLMILPNIHHLHAGSFGRFNTQVGILKNDATCGGNLHAAGGFQEAIGSRLVMFGIFRRYDRIEPVEYADLLKLPLNDPAEAAAGHRHGLEPAMLPGYLDHNVDRREEMQQFQERIFFLVGHADGIEHQPMFVRKHGHDLM